MRNLRPSDASITMTLPADLDRGSGSDVASIMPSQHSAMERLKTFDISQYQSVARRSSRLVAKQTQADVSQTTGGTCHRIEIDQSLGAESVESDEDTIRVGRKSQTTAPRTRSVKIPRSREKPFRNKKPKETRPAPVKNRARRISTSKRPTITDDHSLKGTLIGSEDNITHLPPDNVKSFAVDSFPGSTTRRSFRVRKPPRRFFEGIEGVHIEPSLIVRSATAIDGAFQPPEPGTKRKRKTLTAPSHEYSRKRPHTDGIQPAEGRLVKRSKVGTRSRKNSAQLPLHLRISDKVALTDILSRPPEKQDRLENYETLLRRQGLALSRRLSNTSQSSTSTLSSLSSSRVPVSSRSSISFLAENTAPRPTQQKPKVLLEPPDPRLVAISHKLTERHPIEQKPRPKGKPEVWADTRQALCETVPYFKTPQGGCHQNDGHVYSMFFDSGGHCREYMDTDVIISRSGGGMEMDRHGNLVQCRDHAYSSNGKSRGQPEALLNNIRHHNPVVIICGDRNQRALVKMPHKFCVLGWYKPIHVWTEKTVGKDNAVFKTIKYRFERMASKDAWHSPETQASWTLSDEERNLVGSMTVACCIECHVEHPQVYLCGWMCLSHNCGRLWKLANGADADCDRLDYHPAYLLNRRSWPNEEEPYCLRIPVPEVGRYIGDNLSYINTRGVCCPRCGRCNSRRFFKGWKCENPGCDWEKFPKHFPVKPAQLHSPWDTFGEGPSLGRNTFDSTGVGLAVTHRHGMKIYRYTFEGVNGSLTHVTTNSKLNSAPEGPNDMLDALQQQDNPELELPLERRVFTGTAKPQPNAASPVPDEVLSAHLKKDYLQEGDFMSAYSINYGMPYKFVASGASLPFERAPWPIRHARANLNWASKTILGEGGHTDFNEQLIFAYMEKQKLEYHDDGEKGLGPRIATLSLGASAKMHLRMKQKHYLGCSKTGIFTTERPIPGCSGGEVMLQKRLAAWKELEELRLTDRPQYLRRQKEIPHELGIFKDRNKTRSGGDLVVLTLNHGDIVLMEGYDIQKYFEHKVQSEGYLRFALTCRTVLDSHLRPEERPAYDVPPDNETISCLMRLDIDKAKAEAEARSAQEHSLAAELSSHASAEGAQIQSPEVVETSLGFEEETEADHALQPDQEFETKLSAMIESCESM